MKFELTYFDGSKVTVDVPDDQLRAWLAGKAQAQAMAQVDKAQEVKGAVLSAVVKE